MEENGTSSDQQWFPIPLFDFLKKKIEEKSLVEQKDWSAVVDGEINRIANRLKEIRKEKFSHPFTYHILFHIQSLYQAISCARLDNPQITSLQEVMELVGKEYTNASKKVIETLL